MTYKDRNKYFENTLSRLMTSPITASIQSISQLAVALPSRLSFCSWSFLICFVTPSHTDCHWSPHYLIIVSISSLYTENCILCTSQCITSNSPSLFLQQTLGDLDLGGNWWRQSGWQSGTRQVMLSPSLSNSLHLYLSVSISILLSPIDAYTHTDTFPLCMSPFLHSNLHGL